MPRNRSSADYIALGTKIADAFVSHGADLTDSLEKIAKEEDLNIHQISRVAEAANQRTFQQKFASRDGGDVQFPPANAEEVVKRLNMPEKVAWDQDLHDYDTLPECSKTASLTDVIAANFGKDLTPLLPELEKTAQVEEAFPNLLGTDTEINSLEEFEKRASEHDPRDPDLSYGQVASLCEKLAAAKNVFTIEKQDILKMAQEERDKFVQICRRMVKAGHKIEELMKVAFQSRPDQRDSLKTLFGYVISNLDKTAAFDRYISGFEVDPKMISKRLDKVIPPHGVTVINGAHPVTLSIDILADLSKQWDQANRGEAIAQREIDKAQKVRSAFTMTTKGRKRYDGGIRRLPEHDRENLRGL